MIVTALAAQQAIVQPSRGLSLEVAPEVFATSPSGVEVIQVVVAPTGVIVACNARIVGRGPVEDRGNCKKLSKLKATPATDQAGGKLYGMAEFRLDWSDSRLGRPAGPPPTLAADFYLPVSRLPEGWRSDKLSRLTLVAGADGKVETCAVLLSSGEAALDNAACRAVSTTGIAPLKDSAGAVVRAVHNVAVGFTAQR